jgi:hypothetical protein
MPALWITLLVVGSCVVAAALRFRWRPHLRGWRRAQYVSGLALLAIGAIGFLLPFVAVGGGRNWLPGHFELPVGRASGVIDLRSGEHVVPLEHAGRIQLYDADWRFLRGWQLDAGGGVFALDRAGAGKVQVVTARMDRMYVFALDGRLLSNTSSEPHAYDRFGRNGYAVTVPTHPLLWVWSGPFCSWLTAVLGGVIISFAERRRARGVCPK